MEVNRYFIFAVRENFGGRKSRLAYKPLKPILPPERLLDTEKENENERERALRLGLCTEKEPRPWQSQIISLPLIWRRSILVERFDFRCLIHLESVVFAPSFPTGPWTKNTCFNFWFLLNWDCCPNELDSSLSILGLEISFSVSWNDNNPVFFFFFFLGFYCFFLSFCSQNISFPCSFNVARSKSGNNDGQIHAFPYFRCLLNVPLVFSYFYIWFPFLNQVFIKGIWVRLTSFLGVSEFYYQQLFLSSPCFSFTFRSGTRAYAFNAKSDWIRVIYLFIKISEVAFGLFSVFCK